MLLKSKVLVLVAFISFLTNLAWENLHAPLYQGYNVSWHHFLLLFRAALGDVVIILVIYGIISIVHKNLIWIKSITKLDIILSIFFGIVIAVGFEWFALSTHRWQYTQEMPIIPLINVGLSPVLQMIVLPLVTFFITNKIFSKLIGLK